MASYRKRRGFALAITLLFLSLLIVMVGALFLAVRNKLYLSQSYRDQTAALYLAELAINDARSQLEADATWTGGFKDQSLPGVEGTYTLEFDTGTGPFDTMESINNWDGTHRDTYHGPGTLQPGHCLLIATATVGRSTRTVEALVKVGGGMPPMDVALINDGRIVMRGQALVEGVRSLVDPIRIPAGLHSNLIDPSPNLVDLSGLANTSDISGEITSSGTSGGAINLGTYGSSHTGGSASNSAQKAYPDIDIVSQVSSKSGSPSPSLTPLGTTVLSDAGGADYYHSGPLVLNGDLVLENVSLYVNGPLTINGSITGQGSLYVTGKSSFQGSASVTTARPDKVALYSHGSVEIKGFDGTAFLNAAGSDPALSGFSYNQHLNNFRSDLTELANEFADPSAVWGQDSKADSLRENIARGQATLPTQFIHDPNTNLSRNLGYMIGLLPPSSAQGPLQKKFDDITGIFTGTLNYDDQSLAALDRAKADRLEYYSVDNIIDFELYEHRSAMEAMVRGMNFDRPGETFFQGLVYTHGYIHASQEVTIVGGVAAVQSSSGPPVPTEIVDGDTLKPGDVYLLDGSRLLYVEDFFNPTAVHPGAGGEGTSVHLWMGR